MNFALFDKIFLVIFLIVVFGFLYIRRKKVDREGIFVFLYRTNIGLKIIEYISEKHKKTLKVMSYVIVFLGYCLMIFAIYLVYNIIKLFLQPDMVRLIKLPPIAPLIPYLPEIFKISWLPPFYFIYWIVALALVAILHEGFHGVYARYHKVKIKSTGFGFFWPLLSLLFFVEQDDKQMTKKKIFPQLTILAAGVFANLLLTIFFVVLFLIFISTCYAPAGVIFGDYTYSPIPISVLNNANITNEIIIVEGVNLTKIIIEGNSYFVHNTVLDPNYIKNASADTYLKAYWNEPAILNGMKGVIIQINSKEVKKLGDISEETSKFKPGENITITTYYPQSNNETFYHYNFKLGFDYRNESKPALGIATLKQQYRGFGGFIMKIRSYFQEDNIYYKPKINKDFAKFINDFFLWLMLINFSVAATNMIPAGMFDGGRFFYLTILAITKKKKIAEKTFAVVTWFLVFALVLLMFLWAKAMFFK